MAPNVPPHLQDLINQSPICDKCMICLEQYNNNNNSNECILSCGHIYHKNCLNEWEVSLLNTSPMKYFRTSTCPICRTFYHTKNNKWNYVRSRVNILLQILLKLKSYTLFSWCFIVNVMTKSYDYIQRIISLIYETCKQKYKLLFAAVALIVFGTIVYIILNLDEKNVPILCSILFGILCVIFVIHAIIAEKEKKELEEYVASREIYYNKFETKCNILEAENNILKTNNNKLNEEMNHLMSYYEILHSTYRHSK